MEANLWPAYIRGLAYLRQHSGPQAAAEFQKLLDHQVVTLNWFPIHSLAYPLYPLAHLGLARAAAAIGDTARSRKAYEDFFGLWKDADPDIPILIEARQEYEKLK
jgi:hypothetical protein